MVIYSNGRIDSRNMGNLGKEKKDQAVSSNVLFFSLNDSQRLNNILPKLQIKLVTNKEIV